MRVLRSLGLVFGCLAAVGTLYSADDPPGAEPGVSNILQVDIENYTTYVADVSDYGKLAADRRLTAVAQPRTFSNFIGVADIVRINGQPARGTFTVRGTAVNQAPDAQPGQAMADTARACVVDWLLELQQADGRTVGTIIGTGLGGGPPTPGAPAAVSRTLAGTIAITGGTGPYVGMRGQAAYSRFVPQPREASAAEDPADRRTRGGGAGTLLLHLIPINRPEITGGVKSPWIFHEDWSGITYVKPAMPGEQILIVGTDLGPVYAAMDPGELFPEDPPSEIAAPVEVLVNGRRAIVTTKVGLGAMFRAYYILFLLPVDTPPGVASIRLYSAWMHGAEYKIIVGRK